MNNLQKIGGLLAKEGRTIVYGIPQTVTADNIVSLSVGESDDSVRSLYDKRGVGYTVLEADVYATDYISGYDLLLTVKNEIENAVKSTVRIIFKRFPASEYDERLQRHVLRSQYKIIE